jgi:hypothetical protein
MLKNLLFAVLVTVVTVVISEFETVAQPVLAQLTALLAVVTG